jgi:hypothetical protein
MMWRIKFGGTVTSPSFPVLLAVLFVAFDEGIG